MVIWSDENGFWTSGQMPRTKNNFSDRKRVWRELSSRTYNLIWVSFLFLAAAGQSSLTLCLLL